MFNIYYVGIYIIPNNNYYLLWFTQYCNGFMSQTENNIRRLLQKTAVQ